MRVHNGAIRPVVTYGANTMCMTDKVDEKLEKSEKKIIRVSMAQKWWGKRMEIYEWRYR